MDLNYIIGVTCAILASFCGSVVITQYKALRMQDVSSRTTIAIRGLTIPFWLVGFLIFVFYFGKNPDIHALSWVFIWAITGASSALIRAFLMKYQNLSELDALLRGTLFMVLLFSDFLFFDQELKITTIIAASVLIMCGIVFSSERTITEQKFQFKGSYLKVIGIVLFLSLLVAVQLVFYKKAALIQNDPLFFAFMAALIINPVNFMIDPKGVMNLVKKSKDSEHRVGILRPIFLIIIMLILVEITQAKAYLELPLVIVNVTAVIPMIVYFITDRLNGEIAWSKKSVIALTLSLLSIVAIMTA